MFRECSRKYSLSIRSSSVWIFPKCSPNVPPILKPNIRLSRIFREYSANIPLGTIENIWVIRMFAEYSLHILRRIFGSSNRGTFSKHSGNIQTHELLKLSEYLREHSRNIPWISFCYLWAMCRRLQGGGLSKRVLTPRSQHGGRA